ncbi:MAG TPA: type II secretion system protein GspM [Gemmatimonadota bacterium]
MTARERRTIRWGAAAVGVILGWLLVVDPWMVRTEEARALAAERESRLARLEALQASLPAWRDRLDEARAVWAADVAPRLLPGDVPAVAASFLSEEVRRLAAMSYLDIERESVLPSGERDGFVTVPVQFSLRGDVYGLRDFLAALESAVRFLHLRELRVTSMGQGFAPAGSVGAPLQLTITLEGYLAGADVPGGAAPAPSVPVPDEGSVDDGGFGAEGTGAGGGRLDANAAAPSAGAAPVTPPADVDPDVPGAPPRPADGAGRRSPAFDGRGRMEDQRLNAPAAVADPADVQDDAGGFAGGEDVVDPEVE